MFDYKKYEKEYNDITEEENKKYDWDNMDVKKMEAANKKRSERINELNKKNRIIFKHELRNAWMEKNKSIYIFDTDMDNIFIVDYKNKKESFYSIDSEELKKIKEYISQFEYIFSEIEIPFPPVLDGTSHSVYISNFDNYRQIECSNLWYFIEGNLEEDSIFSSTKIQKEYTKEMIKVILDIQEVLKDNTIDFDILID